MAASFSDARIYQIPYNRFVDAVCTPQFSSTLRLQFLRTIPLGAGCTYRFSHGMSFSSYGEDVEISILPTGPSTTQININSTCSVPTQVIDWGKNRENVMGIWKYFDQYLAYQPQPVQQIPQGGYCTGCGNPLSAGSKFCPKCGKQQG